MENQLALGMVEKHFNKIHDTEGSIKPFFGMSILKYISPKITTVIKVLNP